MTKSRVPAPSMKRTLSRVAVAGTVGAVFALSLAGIASASPGDESDCTTVTFSKGTFRSTVRVVNDCSYDVGLRINMIEPTLNGVPCNTVRANTSWHRTFLNAYHIFFGTEFC